MNKRITRLFAFILAMILTLNSASMSVFAAEAYNVHLKIDFLKYSQQYQIAAYYLKDGYNLDDLDKYRGIDGMDPDMSLEDFNNFRDDMSDPYDPRGELIRIIDTRENIKGSLDLPMPNGLEYFFPDDTYEYFDRIVDIPEARDQKIVIAIIPSGNFYSRSAEAEPRTTYWARLDGFINFMILDPQQDENGIPTEPKIYRNPAPQNSQITFTDGFLRYFCGDPVDPLTGSFIWNYTDLKIGGKHELDYTRFYNSLDGPTTELGKGWSDAFRYQLQVDDEKAYFTTPYVSGTPFTYVPETNQFAPSSMIASDYSLEFTEVASAFMMPEQTYEAFIEENQPTIAKQKLREDNILIDTNFDWSTMVTSDSALGSCAH